MFSLKRNVLLGLAVLAVSGVALGQPVGAVVIKPVDVEASQIYNDYTAIKAIDGSGLTATLDTGADAADVAAVMHHGYASGVYDGWDTYNTTVGASIEVELADVMNGIDGIWVWNGISSGTKGDPITSVQVEVSVDGSTYVDMGLFSLTKVDYDDDASAQYLQFSSVQDSVQFIKITVDAVSDDGSSTYTGIREIRVAQVPEPMTMSLLAVGGLALLRRRRA